MSASDTTAIFITGNSRSGTTMLSRILGNHPLIYSFQELHFFDELLKTASPDEVPDARKAATLMATLMAVQRNGYFGSRNTKPYTDEAAEVVSTLKKPSYAGIFRSFLFNESQKQGREIPCEQTPQNIFYLDAILKSFPTAKVLVMVRDPRAVLLSQKKKWKRRALSGGKIPFYEMVRSRINYHPVTMSKIWNNVMLTAKQYHNHSSVMVVRYEDLIEDPRQVVQHICRHLNIVYTASMLDIPVIGSSNFEDSTQTGIDSSKTGQWNKGGLNDAELYICQKITGQVMKSFNYIPVSASVNPVRIGLYYVLLPVSLILALLFNVRRLMRPMEILRRFTFRHSSKK